MPVNLELLKKVKDQLEKQAFAPMGPMPAPPPGAGAMPPGGAPPMDPSMMGGAPPMDPAMMGGAPGGGMPPMDPAMMGAPMDPAMMGGAPPMDPSMMGMPPGDPAAMAADPAAMGGTPMTVEMFEQMIPDLAAAIKDEIKGGGGDSKEDMEERLTMLEEQIAQLTGGEEIPPEDVGALPGGEDVSTGAVEGEVPIEEGMTPEAIEAAGQAPPPGPPMDPGMGMPPPGMAPPGMAPMDAGGLPPMPVMASARGPAKPVTRIQDLVRKLRNG